MLIEKLREVGSDKTKLLEILNSYRAGCKVDFNEREIIAMCRFFIETNFKTNDEKDATIIRMRKNIKDYLQANKELSDKNHWQQQAIQALQASKYITIDNGIICDNTSVFKPIDDVVHEAIRKAASSVFYGETPNSTIHWVLIQYADSVIEDLIKFKAKQVKLEETIQSNRKPNEKEKTK